MRGAVALSLVVLLLGPPALAGGDRNRGQKLGDGLIIAGSVLMSLGHLTSASLGILDTALSCGVGEGNLYPCTEDETPLWGILPVAGGWVEVDHAGDVEGALMYAAPALVQTVGFSLLLAGGIERQRATSKTLRVGLMPLSGGAAISIGGRF